VTFLPHYRHMIIGYARVSTTGQTLDRQMDALRDAGCERIYMETGSRDLDNLPQLEEMKRNLREGDIVVVDELSRFGSRTLRLLQLAHDFGERGVGLRSLTERFDPDQPEEDLLFIISAWMATNDLNVIRERTRSGLKAAKARGRCGGRPTVIDADKAALIRRGLAAGESKASIARALGVDASTIRRHLQRVTGAAAKGATPSCA
jgi:DNA invertase Pin-like site-specific DNA recombinase